MSNYKHPGEKLISIAYLHEQLRYDSETGLLWWRVRRRRRQLSRPASIINRTSGYYRIALDNGYLFAHRVIWAMQTGAWPKEEIDHINGDVGDNRISNLREATRSQNRANSVVKRNTKTGVKGVSICERTGRYITQLGANNHMVKVGRYATLEEAQSAVIAAREILHGEFGSNRIRETENHGD